MQDDPIIPEPENDVQSRRETGRTSGRHSPPPGAPVLRVERVGHPQNFALLLPISSS